MFKSKKFWYISLFAILYLIVAFSSFWHACAFFGLANNTWMSIILAFAFEVGQAAVLFSLLTSKKDRSRIMPWVLMTMFTLVQVIGNVFSSYKYLITHSVEDLKYFKEPIFIWMDLPDQEATVIITYVVGAILPVAALLLTSMITNYLTDIEEENLNNIIPITAENGPSAPIKLKNEEEFIDLYNDRKEPRIDTEESKSNNDVGEQQIDNIENKESSENTITDDSKQEDNEISTNEDTEISRESEGSESGLETDKSEDGNDDLEDEMLHEPSVEVKEEIKKQPSHFINI